MCYFNFELNKKKKMSQNWSPTDVPVWLLGGQFFWNQELFVKVGADKSGAQWGVSQNSNSAIGRSLPQRRKHEFALRFWYDESLLITTVPALSTCLCDHIGGQYLFHPNISPPPSPFSSILADNTPPYLNQPHFLTETQIVMKQHRAQ